MLIWTKNYLFQKKYSGIKYFHTENYYNDFSTEILLPYKQSTLGPFINKGDVNNDGMIDIFIGGAYNQEPNLFINTRNQ